MKISSPAFAEGEPIPALYTCEGSDISPPLQWSGVPAGASSLALVCDDPDAPMGTWVHWVVYDIPADVQSIEEGQLPLGGKCGRNDWMRSDYGGPCPPVGRHRYVHTLYALDRFVANFEAPTKEELLKEMNGHVLQTAVLVGTYEKAGRFIAR